jgi:magnesium chelatase family protein
VCLCGYLGDPVRESRRGPPTIQRYQKQIGGPLLDRSDIHVEVLRIEYGGRDDARRVVNLRNCHRLFL